MLKKITISNALTVILALCALFITGLILQRIFSPPVNTAQIENSNIREIENWEELGIENLQTYSANAELNILKFYDYECPFCKQSQTYIDEVNKKYKGNVNFVYVHFPRLTHELAFNAAVASECARNQEVFEEYHALLFKNQENLDQVSFSRLAIQADVKNITEFNNCIDQEITRDIINQNIALANRLKVNVIPSYLINGILISGILTTEELEEYIFNE